MIVIIKALLLFSLVFNGVVAGYQGDHDDSLDDLPRRVLDRLQSRSYENVRKRSWDYYIDNLIAQSKDASGTAHVDRACIIGLDGGFAWTTDAHPNALKLTAAEGRTIARAFKSKDFTPFMADGVRAEGITYRFMREEDKKVVYAKKAGAGALTLQASKTAIVIAHCPEGKQQGNANKGVSVLAEYLESLGM